MTTSAAASATAPALIGARPTAVKWGCTGLGAEDPIPFSGPVVATERVSTTPVLAATAGRILSREASEESMS
jgi:hypothetical protein